MKSTILLGFFLLASVLTPLLAQERPAQGRMWTFEDPPLGRLEKEHGFKPDANWLSALRLGSLRLGGGEIESGFGSASFVSPEGLILTSSHCVRELAVSTEKPIVWMRKRISWMMQDGFVAASRGDELRLRTLGQGWLSAAQLIKTSDVTGKVDEGVEVTDGAAATQARREANRRAILAAARDADPDLVPQIVSFHQGASCRLYQYRVYSTASCFYYRFDAGRRRRGLWPNSKNTTPYMRTRPRTCLFFFARHTFTSLRSLRTLPVTAARSRSVCCSTKLCPGAAGR